VLSVLRRATEDKPEDRYQTVQEFWADLADAALPPTQPLELKETEAHPRPSSKLTKIAAVVTGAAPPRARFDSHDAIRQSQISGNGAKRPRIVVPVNEARPNVKQTPQQQPPLAQIPPAPLVQPTVKVIRSSLPLRQRRSFRALVALLIIVAFAGILLATHYYVSRHRALNPPPAGNTNSPYVGREVTVSTTAFLRKDPTMSSNPPLRQIERGARVRILSVNDNNTWFEVEIVATADNQPDANPITRGWMGRKVLQID
jgi:hypothetical protein